MTFLRKRLLNYVAPIAAVKGDIANPILDRGFQNEAFNMAQEFLAENGIFNKLKINGLRAIESDYYEFAMRINNVEEELDALQILREINNRMSALDSYISGGKLSEHDKKKYQELYGKYSALRDVLSKKKIWKKANYGLFYDYNDLSPSQMQSYEPT